MAVGDIRAGRAFVELFLKNNLNKGLSQAGKQLTSFGRSTSAIGRSVMGVGAMVAGAGAAMSAAFIKPIQAASDLMETTSKFKAVFGEQSEAATSWMNNFTKQVGRGKREAMDGMSAFQAFFTGMGMGGDQAAELSKKMTALAVDFGSFHNVSDPESMQRFISALSGSSEVLDMFGINIKQSALDLKLLEMGFPSIAKGADETQKVMARMAIITEAMGRQGAVGDAVRTAGSFGNQMKALKGSLADAAAEIGGALLPVVTPLVKQFATGVKWLAAWSAENHGIVRALALTAVGTTAAGVAIAGLGVSAMVAGSAIAGVGAVAAAMLSPVGAAVAVIGGAGVALAAVTGVAVAGVAAWMKYTNAGRATATAIGMAFGALANRVMTTLAPITDIAKSTWGGIVDAISTGDLALAGQIAMAGLNATFLTGINAIADSMGSFGTIFSQVLTGDLRGAWDTTVAYLANTWDSLATGMVGAFTLAVNKVKGMWNGVIAATKASMLAMSAYLRSIGQEGAAASVGAASASLSGLGSSVGNGLGAISTAGDAVTAGLAGRMNASNAGVSARDNAAKMARDAALQAAQSELSGLTGKARAQREQEIAAAAMQSGGATPAMQAATAASQSFGSFSAAALTAGGGGGGVQGKILEEAKRGNKAVAEKIDRQTEEIKKLQLQVIA